MSQSKADYYVEENQRLTIEVEQAMITIHDLNRKLTNANAEIEKLKVLVNNSTAYAVGERGRACMSIDGGNL